VYHKEAERALRAAEVVEEFPNKGLMNEARAIAVIPSVKKAAFIFGARWGKGLLTVRDDNGCWLPPSYIQITGGNFGFQAGVEAVDLVLIFTNRDAVNALLNGKMTINGDASAAAGPVGGTAQAGVPLLVNSGIVTFVSKSKGLFAGISLDGAAITINDTANERVYGKWINGDEILLGKRVEPNEVVAPFLNALATHAPGHTLVPVQGVAGSPTTVATPTKPTN
jgi:lipid-binding SYLF domain-containing protein